MEQGGKYDIDGGGGYSVAKEPTDQIIPDRTQACFRLPSQVSSLVG